MGAFFRAFSKKQTIYCNYESHRNGWNSSPKEGAARQHAVRPLFSLPHEPACTEAFHFILNNALLESLTVLFVVLTILIL